MGKRRAGISRQRRKAPCGRITVKGIRRPGDQERLGRGFLALKAGRKREKTPKNTQKATKKHKKGTK
jgi:hypothetical protein